MCYSDEILLINLDEISINRNSTSLNNMDEIILINTDEISLINIDKLVVIITMPIIAHYINKRLI